MSSRSAKCSSDPKGFQATLHDTTSKEKLANSDDNTNAKETDDTTEKLGQCQIGSEDDHSDSVDYLTRIGVDIDDYLVGSTGVQLWLSQVELWKPKHTPNAR